VSKYGLSAETLKKMLDAEWNTAIETAANEAQTRDARIAFAIRRLKRKVEE
jgi:hypothetical protein